jgi:transposase
MISAQQLDALDPQMRQAVQSLLAQVQQRDAEIAFKQALIDKLTHEMAVLKRLKFAATSERFASTLAPEQKSLLEETLEADLAGTGSGRSSAERGRAGDQDKTEKKTAQAHPAAAASAAPRRGARAHRHHLPDPGLRPGDAAHRPGRGREAGLPARGVHRRAPCARQVGVPVLPEAGASPGAGALSAPIQI